MSVRHLCIQTIISAFQQAGYRSLDADYFVRERKERFAVYATTTVVENIADEILADHKLPSNVAIDDLVTFLINARIPSYKKLWARDSESLSRNSAMTDLLQEIYQHWRGEEPAREVGALQFHIVVEGSLSGLGLLITKACHDIDLR